MNRIFNMSYICGEYCECQAYETQMRSIEYLWVREHGAQGHGGKGHGVIIVSFPYIDNMMDFTIYNWQVVLQLKKCGTPTSNQEV